MCNATLDGILYYFCELSISILKKIHMNPWEDFYFVLLTNTHMYMH